MEAPSPRRRIGGSWTGQLLATRRGALSVAAIAAVLAGVLLFLFVQHYKKNPTPVAAAPSNVFVFVAGKYIPAGTPASTIGQSGLLRRTEIASTQVQAGAITDPSAIAGEVSATAIQAGQQVTAADFTKTNITLGAYLTGDQRAIAVPLDASHGLTSYIGQGSTVDVMDDAGGQITMVAQNVSVLENTGGIVVFRASDKLALQLAGLADNTKIWLTLRPPTGATDSVHVGAKAAS